MVITVGTNPGSAGAKASERRAPRTVGEFFKKYLCEGQLRCEDEQEVEAADSAIDHFLTKYRKYCALAVPVTVWYALWLTAAFRHDFFSLYAHTWPVILTAFLACTVAGMTSEGAGAVFFPIMSIWLKIDTGVSRDFSMMCQSAGMTSSVAVILLSGVVIETRAVLFGTIGAFPGFWIGFWIDSLMDGATKKMLFVSIWGSFAIALFLLNAEKKRVTYTKIPDFKPWKAFILILGGMIGGIFTAMTGSGVDVSIFAILTSLFRISEKIATPTTVVLMGLNTVVGFYIRAAYYFDITQEAWEYTFCVVPVCTVMAPLGSLIGTHFHRQALAMLVYVLDAVALIGFLASGPSWILVAIAAAILFAGYLFFRQMCAWGHKIVDGLPSTKRARQALVEKCVTETEATPMTDRSLA